jgi:hypothetical protein
MELIPGFVQGIVRVIVSYPFDYIRANVQSNQYKNGIEFIKSVKLSPKMAYNGVTVPLFTVPFDRAINFYIFEKCKENKLSSIYSSIISTSLCSTYFVPLNYFSTKIILANKPIKEIWSQFKLMSSTQLYKGFTPDITRGFLGSIIFMSSYGMLRDNIPKDKHNYLLFGVVSSISSWTIIYPLDTIRIIKQNTDESYKTLIKKNYNNFYKGFSYILMRSIPSAGIGMMAYEYTKMNITKSNSSNKV